VDDVLHVVPESDRAEGDDQGDRGCELLHHDRLIRSPSIRRPVLRTGTRTSRTPIDFYLLVDGKAIQATDQRELRSDQRSEDQRAIAKARHDADDAAEQRCQASGRRPTEYLAKKAYMDVFGYQTFPFFMSDRMNFAAAVKQPIYGWDFTSFQLK